MDRTIVYASWFVVMFAFGAPLLNAYLTQGGAA